MTHNQYTARKIARITNGKLITSGGEDPVIRDLVIDSRRLIEPEESMFIALLSARNDGHRYIGELIDRGIKCFLVSNLQLATGYKGRGSRVEGRGSRAESPATGNEDPVFIVVPDTLAALQKLAAYHRREFDYPVIAITGSNGKTIVKEWLYQLLSPDFVVIRSPKSYNSQIGVPLSVWNMDVQYNLAIIEAGISQPGEMEKLEEMIYPTIGIFTMIGPAHDELFSDDVEKATEKLKLFRNAEILIYNSDYQVITEQLNRSPDYKNLKAFTWGERDTDDLRIQRITKDENQTTIKGLFQGKEIEITIPFIDNASIENAIHCWAFILVQGSFTPKPPEGGLNRYAKFSSPQRRGSGRGHRGGSKSPSGDLGVPAKRSMSPPGDLGAQTSIQILGNFPYNISSQILFRVIEYKELVGELVGMFQREVALRIASPPGSKQYGILSVLLQAYYDIEYMMTVNETVFQPPPKVKSAVIRLRRNEIEALDCDEAFFIRVVKTAFNQRRKMLRNSLRTLADPGFSGWDDPVMSQRPEQLSVEEFTRLTRLIQQGTVENF